MRRRTEEQPWWPELVAVKDQFSLAELSKRFGVSPASINVALRRTGLSRQAQPAGRKPKRGRRKVGRPSKLGPFAHLVGVQPDLVVAERAGVTLNAVRKYRAKHDIAEPTSTLEETVEAPTSVATPPPTRRSSPTKARSLAQGAWQISAQGGQGVVLAGSLEEAARLAQEAGLGVVRSMHWLGAVV